MTIWRQILILGAALLAAASQAAAGYSRHEELLPSRGVLVAGVSLAGVRLGDTPRDVELAWGTNHTSCNDCRLRTWLFVYPSKPVGAGVAFDAGRAVAVFTLGQPLGWHTQRGLWLGADVHTLTADYDAPSMAYRDCVGYNALSVRRGDVVTSIYTQAEEVYGFALTQRGEPICQ
jgi:hypothetical protein